MGISSKLLLDATGTQASELDSIYSLNDRGRKSMVTLTQKVFGSGTDWVHRGNMHWYRVHRTGSR